MTRAKLIKWGGRRALVQYMTDETERINSQIELRGLLDGIPSGVGMFNYYKDGRFELQYMNEGFYRMIGAKREDRTGFAGVNVTAALHPADRALMLNGIANVVRERRLGNMDIRVLCGDGQYRWMNTKARIAYETEDKFVIYASYSMVDNERKALISLEASNRALELAGRNCGVAFWRLNIDERVITAGDSLMMSSVGYPPVMNNVPDTMIEAGLIHEDDVAEFRRMHEELLAGAESSECTVRMHNGALGRQEWLHIVYTRLHDSDAESRQAIGFSSNVDSQQEMRERYERELEIRRQLIKDSIIYYQVNLNTRMVEEFYSLMPGDPRAETNFVVNSTAARQVLETIAPEDRDAVRDTLFIKGLSKAFADGRDKISLDYRRAIPGKGYRWCQANVGIMRRPVSDEVIAFINVRDIDTQKKDRLALQSGIQEELEVIAILNLETNVIRRVDMTSSEQRDAASKAQSYEATIEEILRENIVREDREAYREFLQIENLIAALETAPNVMITYRVKDEKGVILRKRTLAYYLDSTRADIILSRRDITMLYLEEQRQKRALQAAVDAANEASRAKSEFLSRMSHDMRTPMNVIVGLIDLAQSETDIKQIREYLANIDASGRFLLGLINDILDLSRIESGRIDLREEPYSLSEFTRSIDTVIRPLMEAKRIDFEFDMGCGACSILVDKLRFNQVFFNLLSNAAKYTQEGGRVSFSAVHIPNRGDKHGMRYIVRDNGRGMSAEFMKRLFEPFSQERDENDTTVQGTGLGLAIVKNLVETMGGEISVTSELGKGTEFTVDLYAKMLEKDAFINESRSHDLSLLEGLRVLLVEDNDLNVVVAQKLLERKGCVVEVARNGREAIERFFSSDIGHYHVILMDIRMPILDGLAATRAIRALDRADARAVPILAMTADAFTDDRNKTRKVGMNAHIAKPIDSLVLYNTIAEEVAKSRA